MDNTIKSKKCYRCKEIKPVSEFWKSKRSQDGHRYKCKKCYQNYYQAHRAEILRRRKKYRQTHRAELLQARKEYRQAHRTKFSQYDQKRRNTLQGYLRDVWYHIIRRCLNPKDKDYKNYGERGIKVKFACFDDFFDYVVKELKADPRGLTIDRINNDGHYEKGNIRFVTRAENNRNKRHKHKTLHIN